ncbi:MAG: ABC transporter substrate-binding protein, partial [Bacteroidota bacterium]
MQIFKKTLSIILIGILNFGLFTVPPIAEANKNSGQVKIRYAAFEGMTGLGFWFGKEKGFFKDASLDLEILNIIDKVAAFAAGEVDFADLATTNAIIGAGRGAPFKIVASMFRTKGAFYLIGRPDIKKIADLKGKKVGVGLIGSGMDVYTRVILKENGLDPLKDVTLINNG